MEGVKERLTLFLSKIRVSKTEFGDVIGVSKSYVSSINKSIQPDKLIRIAEEYPMLNIGWLLTGKGEMIIPPCGNNVLSDGSQQVTGNQNNLCMIPEKVLIQEQEANAELRRMLADAQAANARLIALLEKYSLK